MDMYYVPFPVIIGPDVSNILWQQSLMELAKDEGLKVEKRPVPVTELSSLKEVAACGTAVVVTPINRIIHRDQVRALINTVMSFMNMYVCLIIMMDPLVTAVIADNQYWE